MSMPAVITFVCQLGWNWDANHELRKWPVIAEVIQCSFMNNHFGATSFHSEASLQRQQRVVLALLEKSNIRKACRSCFGQKLAVARIRKTPLTRGSCTTLIGQNLPFPEH